VVKQPSPRPLIHTLLAYWRSLLEPRREKMGTGDEGSQWCNRLPQNRRIPMAGIVFLEIPQKMGYESSCAQRSGQEARG
jgi:hypothetical protein